MTAGMLSVAVVPTIANIYKLSPYRGRRHVLLCAQQPAADMLAQLPCVVSCVHACDGYILVVVLVSMMHSHNDDF